MFVCTPVYFFITLVIEMHASVLLHVCWLGLIWLTNCFLSKPGENNSRVLVTLPLCCDTTVAAAGLKDGETLIFSQLHG